MLLTLQSDLQTVRSDRWRYTCWFEFSPQTVSVEENKIIGRELYDHEHDDGNVQHDVENVNVACAAPNAAVVAEHHKQVLGYIKLFPQ